MKHFFKTVLGAFVGTLLALVALVFILVGIFGTVASNSKSEPSATSKNTILKIDLSTPVAEQASESFSFDIMSGSADYVSSIALFDAVRAIDAAAEDPAVKFIYLVGCDMMQTTVSHMEELREALVRFRSSGKAIISYSKNLTIGSYYLASVADKVILNTYGECMFEGLSASVMYYKDLIDKLGVDVQLIRHGKYKSAGEPYIRSDMSQENREQYEVMLGTMWDTVLEGAASSRNFTKEELAGWIDSLKIGSAADAMAMGLVDELWFDDEVDEYLCSVFDVKDVKKLKFTELPEYAAAKLKPDGKIRDKVAILYAQGEIITGEGQDGTMGEDFVEEISKLRRDSSVKAVVFRVNSPGGAVQTSAEIEREIALLRQVKPVVASYGDYAASGGYWISCGCDKIFSDRTTLTGSIGVFGMIPSFGRAISKNLHVNIYEVSTTKHGSLGGGFQPLDNDEVAWVQAMIERTYDDFVTRVSKGRDIPEERVDAIAQGRVWAGGDALNIGLVDEIGGLQEAVRYAAVAAGLDTYRTVEYPVVKTLVEKITESFSKKGPGARAGVPSVETSGEWLKTVSRPAVMARMDNVIVK